MHQVLPSCVRRGMKAVGSRVINWVREWTGPDNHGVVGIVARLTNRMGISCRCHHGALWREVMERATWPEWAIMVQIPERMCNSASTTSLINEGPKYGAFCLPTLRWPVVQEQKPV